ncbi:MAG: glycosyltransferase involved in cell wall biosynthesis [Rhodothermales bacterium]|jgi:glycosyltransferase involved in cell wall biosynthesis
MSTGSRASSAVSLTETAPRRQRVLVVAYYFPPMGLSGVQRTAKFVKYLPDHGWDPVVLTVEPGGYFAFDQQLLQELEERGIPVHRTRSWDPTRLFGSKKSVALPDEQKRQALSSLSQWLFVPDNKIGWLPFALRAGSRLIRAGQFDAILSTAPPYSGHLIAARLARKHRLPLVLDYRDDWVGNPRHHYPTAFHKWLHRRMESYASHSAEAIVCINSAISESQRSRGAAPHVVIPQGFDPEDYEATGSPRPADGVKSVTNGKTSPRSLELLYAGVFYDKQTPVPFLEGLARLLAEQPRLRPHFRATFVGLFPQVGRDTIIRLGLRDVVHVLPYATHREAMKMVSQADVAWLTVGAGPGQNQISTGKLYAYAGAGKPILGLVPQGAAARDLKAYGASWLAHPDRPEEIDRALQTIVDLWREDLLPSPSAEFLSQHDRVYLSKKLAAVLDRVTS